MCASNCDVIRAAARKLRNWRDRDQRRARHAFYRTMLEYHVKARGLFYHVALGR